MTKKFDLKPSEQTEVPSLTHLLGAVPLVIDLVDDKRQDGKKVKGMSGFDSK